MSNGGYTYTYDNQGNTLTQTIDGQITQYIYNSQHEMVGVINPDLSILGYEYNVNGIRTAKSEGGVTTEYVVDENTDYAQVLVESDGGADTAYTFGDDLISLGRDGDFRFYLYDGLGSTRALSDGSGAVTDTYDYEAFGEVLASSGTTENNFRFTGEQYDESLGQYYLRARYYSPSSGRFTQQDPYLGNNFDPQSLHRYTYAHLDPVNNWDPSGEVTLGQVMSTVNTIGTLASYAQTAVTAFNIATGDEEMSAKQIGSALLFNMIGSKASKVIGLFGKRFSNQYKKLGCGKNSFVSGTLVHTVDGMKAIEDLVIGDKVLSFNEATGKGEFEVVTHLISSKEIKAIVEVTLRGGETITSTADHLFFVDGEWIEAQQIVLGDMLKVADGEASLKVEKLEKYELKVAVYNITVANNHNYYVGKEGVLVHNDDDTCILDFASNSITKKLSKRVKKLVKGPGNTHVYLGFSKRDPTQIVYVGITGDIGVRSKQHKGRSFNITKITPFKLPRKLARGIEQALILQYGLEKQGGSLENKINSIGVSRDFYEELVDWGQVWIKNNLK